MLTSSWQRPRKCGTPSGQNELSSVSDCSGHRLWRRTRFRINAPIAGRPRTADLCGLDLTLGDGAVEWWPGLAHHVDFLVDRADAADARAALIAQGAVAGYDVLAADDETWALISWVAGCLLHGRTMLAR